jgi:MinD-like ATPase involved in chromosome partitioning or flagellar assembly
VNLKKKITILDTDDTLFTKMEEQFQKWNFQEYTIEKYHALDELKKNNLGICIIHLSLLNEIEMDVKRIQHQSDRIILLVDELNNPAYSQAYLKGIQVHYRNAPFNSLLFKIVNKNEIEVSKKGQSESEQIHTKNKIISFMSSTGGVGKSTLALNTALQLSDKGKKVLLIDFSVFSNTAISLKLKNDNKGLDNLISELDRLGHDEVETNYLNLFSENIKGYKIKKSSIDVLYGDSPIKLEKISSDMIQTIFEGLLELDYDFVIIDTSSELSEKNLAIAELSDDIILCGVPDIACGWKLIKLKEILDHMQLSTKCKLVINKYSKKVVFSCKQLELELNIPLIGVIPHDAEFQYLSNRGTPIALQSSKTNNYIKYLAHNLSPVFDAKEIKLKEIKV